MQPYLRSIALIGLLVAAAGCGSSTTPSNPAGGAASNAANVAADVVSLPGAQQNLVFFRAIRDAGLPCQEIRSAVRQAPSGKNPEWVVACEDRIPHLIAIAPDGTARITSRTQP